MAGLRSIWIIELAIEHGSAFPTRSLLAASVTQRLQQYELRVMKYGSAPAQSIDSEATGRASTLAYKEFEFKKGDVVYMKMASGGGYGDPLERDPQLVLEDVIDGLVSEQAAQEVYGVVLDEQKEAADFVQTKSLRANLQKKRLATSS